MGTKIINNYIYGNSRNGVLFYGGGQGGGRTAVPSDVEPFRNVTVPVGAKPKERPLYVAVNLTPPEDPPPYVNVALSFVGCSTTRRTR